MPAASRPIPLLLALAALAAGCGEERAKPRPETPTPTTTPARTMSPAAWPHHKLVAHLTGRQIRIAGTAVRLDAATLTCHGVGQPTTRPTGTAWAEFRCIQPTFPPDSVAGPDAIFTVRPVDAGRLEITGARMTGYEPAG
jgi:hypothetical protein